MRWLSMNSELAPDGIYKWTLPALGARLADGKIIKTCPNAGACASLCYARAGTFRFPNVKEAHKNNLELTRNLPQFEIEIMNDLSSKTFEPTYQKARYFDLLDLWSLTDWQRTWAMSGGKAVRIHDSGDFYSREYLETWMRIVRMFDHIFFYAYTKEVALAKSIEVPHNFVFIYSLGGKQDHMLDKDADRHSEVFPNMSLLMKSGYTHNLNSDILAAMMPSNRVGLLRSNIPEYRERQGLRTFGQIQEEM